jgi:putative peptidoglycan lipid II flippase
MTPPSPERVPPRRSVARGAFTVMGGTLASRVSGLLREILTVAFLSARASDAFRIAWVIPNLFRELLAEGALTNAFVPTYQRLSAQQRRAFAGAMAALLALVNAVLLALVLFFAPAIVDLFLAADSHVDRDLTIALLRVAFPVLSAISASALAMGILQAEERFFAPAWAPVALNVAAIAALVIWPGEAIALAWGVSAGGLLQALVQLPAMARARLLPRLGRFWHAAMPAALALMLPFAFTTGARQITNVVAQRIVSNEALFAPGAVTAYALASLLFGLLLGLFAISPAVAFYARLGNLASSGDAAGFAATLGDGARFILLLTLPAGAFAFAFAAPAVGVTFGLLRPAPGQEVAIALAAEALAPLGFALPAVGLANFLLRPFYVRGRVWAPVATSVAFTLLTAIAFTLLAPRFGIAGLSWATAAAAFAQATLLLVWLRGSERLPLRAVASEGAKVAVVAVAAALVAHAAARAAVAALALDALAADALTLLVAAFVAPPILLLGARLLRVPLRRGTERGARR